MSSSNDQTMDERASDLVSEDNDKKRRHSILAVLKDESLSPLERRRSIQNLMDGRSTVRADDRQDISGGANDSCIRTTARAMEQARPPCTHYNRNCSIISPCCGRVFGCRMCHDEAFESSAETITNSCTDASFDSHSVTQSHSSNHKIDRFSIQEVICRLCFTRQSSKTNQCTYCKVAFAEYHCSICNLWMSKEDHPFHCNYCGFCRLRGKSKASYQHCSHCNMCILEHVIHDHNCQKDKYKTNCPICFEDLFSSRTAIHEMNCGHSIHWHCFQTLNHNTLDTAADYSSRCPLCKKTADSHELMRPTWNAIATAIQIQPIPTEYAQVVTIFCNDCNVKCACRPWHFLGVQCTECRSFNTSIIETVFTGEAAVEYLRRSAEQTNGST